MSDLVGWLTCLAGGSIGTEEGDKDYEPKSYRIRLYLHLDLDLDLDLHLDLRLDLGVRWMT